MPLDKWSSPRSVDQTKVKGTEPSEDHQELHSLHMMCSCDKPFAEFVSAFKGRSGNLLELKDQRVADNDRSAWY